MKEKNKKKVYFRRTRKLLETKQHSRNLFKGINIWAILLVRYSGPFLKWTIEELQKMDQRTRKLIAMHKTLHPRDDVDKLYVPRKGGGRGLANIQDSVDALIQWQKDYIKKRGGRLIAAIRSNTDNTNIKQNKNNQKTKMGKNNCLDISSDKQAKETIRDKLNLFW